MAAYFTFKSGFSLEIHQGTDLKKNFRHVNDWMDIVSVQCDGDELDLADKILKTVSTRRVVTFIESEARKIAVNWNHC